MDYTCFAGRTTVTNRGKDRIEDVGSRVDIEAMWSDIAAAIMDCAGIRSSSPEIG